jgi:hypothetical protein
MNTISRFALACVLTALSTQTLASPPKAGLLTFVPAGVDAERDGQLTREVEAAGYVVRPLNAAAIHEPADIGGVDLLLLPDAATLPIRTMAPIRDFLAHGGDIIALDAPLWQRPMLELDGQWITREQYAYVTAIRKPEHVLLDFAAADIARCHRNTNRPEWPATYESKPEGPAAGSPALHVQLSNIEGWDSLSSPELQAPFPAGHTLTVFSARGSATTASLAVEWVEKDDSRWIAVVPLTSEWSRFVLGPKDFHYWQSNPAREHGSGFNPANAVRLSIGLAISHTGQASGPQEYWVAGFGTARVTPELAEVAAANDPTPLEALTPEYKFFDCTGVSTLQVRNDQCVINPATLAVPTQLRSPQPRPRGAGFDKGRNWRWIPLLEARSADGQWRGTPMTLLAHCDGPYKGGMWASCGVADPAWYRSPEALKTIRQVATRMRDGAFILDGGSDKYTYFEGQPLRLGLRAAELGAASSSPRNLTARVTVRDAGGTTVFEKQWPLRGKVGDVLRVAEEWILPQWSDAGLSVTAELLEGQRVIDRVSHEVHVWRPKPEKHFISRRNGQFELDGKPWRAHGINYMPSSGIGTEDGGYFENWLGARAYDPEVIDRDIAHLRELGFNAVSIFIYHEAIKDQNLIDILRRLDAAGMKANLALRPCWPLSFEWAPIKEIIEYCRLAENDTVFAYDLAWEPMWRGHDQRVPYDAAWAKWIVERYGSVEAAEKDWAFKLPRTPDGKGTNPLGAHVDADGPWRRMTAAYRRFLDTLLYEKYGAARRLVRSVDPHHLVSFRMAEAANPTLKLDGWISYDWPYLAAAVDILCPEAYGRIGDWEKVKPGWFQAAYACWAGPELPMMWAECGVSVLELGRKAGSPERLEYQAQFYRDFYRMLAGSGADGVFFWWYPGGFRVGEGSDYGIINPDGTDRPVTAIIRGNAKKFVEGLSSATADHWIEFDRDAHTDGVTGIYAAVKDAFWKAIADGHVPGLKTSCAGMDSANCPLLAVGNVPCNGSNPPKYLDASFDSVEIMDAKGEWKAVENGGKCVVPSGKPALARVTLTNLGEAAWSTAAAGDPAGTAGAVRLLVEGDVATATIPLPKGVPHLGTLTLSDVQLAPSAAAGPNNMRPLTLRLDATGRTPFGPKFTLRFTPAR